MLTKFEDMFDGILGMQNNALVDLELKVDSNPVCSHTYPLLKVHWDMFKSS